MIHTSSDLRGNNLTSEFFLYLNNTFQDMLKSIQFNCVHCTIICIKVRLKAE